MIDKIAIVGCGKGTRLNPFTNYIPKVLVNINNDNILCKIINYWKKYCNSFVILINKEYNSYINFYLNMQKDITYELRNIEILNNEENSYTIKEGLYDLEDLSILITWCDIFPTEEINFDIIKSNCIFINSFSNYNSRYLAFNNKITKVTNYNLGNVVGIYYFKKFKKLINKNDNQDICDCYLDNYDNFCTYELNNIIDIGDMEKLNAILKNNTFNSRYFNNLTQINKNIIKKQANCEYGIKIIKDEINFYKYIENNDISFPIEKIFNITDSSFCMKYLKETTLYHEISRNNNNNNNEIFNILFFLKNMYSNNKKTVDIRDAKTDIYLETITKIKTRNKNIEEIIKDFSYIQYVNFVKIDTYENILCRLENIISSFLINKNTIEYNIIHGDLNLSNIFKIDDKYVFIDPRGYFGNSKIYGFKYYELSKIFISIFGFDSFNNNNEYYFLINHDNMNTNISMLFERIEIYSELFTDDEYEFILCLAISIWLGIPYYFKNNILKVIGSYFYSLYLATVYLDKIEILIQKKKLKKITMPIQKKIIIKDSSINETTYNQLIKTKNINLKQEIESYRRLVVQKPWGHEFVCCEMDNLSLLVLHIKKGHSTSLHAHSYKDTPMLLAQGTLVIESLDTKYEIKPNQPVIINRKIFHKLCSYSDDTVVLEFEMKTPNKNDLIRYKDNYSRESLHYESKDKIIQLCNINDYDNYGYFEYNKDSKYIKQVFNNCEITFINDIFENNLFIQSDNIIVLLEGKINIEGIYFDECSILYGYQILNKYTLYLTNTFTYLIYKKI
jgi:mannose-6-phosphate isomerase-like protein (cupin superfamily)